MRGIKGAGLLLVMGAAIAVMAQEQQPQSATLTMGSATVNEIKGEVVLLAPDGSALSSQRGQVLPPESTITTKKGSVLLDLQDGSQVLIKAQTRVVLKAPNQGAGYSLQLFLGKILAKVKKRLGEEPPFRMGTPTAVITVRGTRFSVEVTKKNKTLVYVFEGVVEVNGRRPGSRPVLIQPGYSTQVAVERDPEGPRSLTPEMEQQGGPGSRIGQTGEQEDTQHAPSHPSGEPTQGREPD